MLEECWGPFEDENEAEEIVCGGGKAGDTMRILMEYGWHQKQLVVTNRVTPGVQIERKFEHVPAAEKDSRF